MKLWRNRQVEIRGELIQKRRKELKMNQVDLSRGICTQATISNVESKNQCDSVDILNKICQRLDMDMTLLFYADSEETIREAIEEVKELCQKGKAKEAYEVIRPLLDKEISDPLLKTAFYYSVGWVYFLTKGNESETLFYLHQATDTLANNTIYRPLAYCLLGQFYENHGEIVKADMHYKKSLDLLKQLTIAIPMEAIGIYYQVGKYYRNVGKIKEAKAILNKGLSLNRDQDTLYLLENQLYELALCEPTETATIEDCLAIARFKGNKQLVKEIASKKA